MQGPERWVPWYLHSLAANVASVFPIASATFPTHRTYHPASAYMDIYREVLKE